MRSFASSLLLALVAGCSSGGFDVAPSDVDAGSVDDASTTDATSTDAAADTQVDPDTGTSDVASPDATACDPTATPDEKLGFFASPSGSDSAGDGSRLKPYRTIGLAMKSARGAGRSRVFLDVGAYAEGVGFVDSTPGIVVEGGWKATGAAWTRNCAADARAQTVINAPTAVAVLAEGVVHLSGLRTLTVTTKSSGSTVPGKPGESVIGVFVRGAGSVFSLDDVAVVAGNAGDGGAASKGAPGLAPSCTGLACGTGGAGAGGGDGNAAKVPGRFGPSGFTPEDGQPGKEGQGGANGTPGADGVSADCVAACTGEGGVCGGFCGNLMTTKSAEKGKCGCGGGGGGGGHPGRGGGAAVGVLVVGSGASVQIARSSVKAGDGGDGSPGGLGESGAPGSSGSAGAPTSCPASCGRTAACECAPQSTSTLAGGAAGGKGGTGGKGGAGGGGAGGPSIGVATLDGATVKLEGTPVEHGKGGVGAGGAPFGIAAQQFP